MRILCVYMDAESAKDSPVHNKTFSILRRYGVLRIINRERMKPVSGFDLVVSLGGDGTFLKASRYIEDTPLLGMNRSPKEKEGFYTRANLSTLDERMRQFIQKKHTIIPLVRLQATLGKKQLPLALNEYFIGAKTSYHSAKYRMCVGNKKEVQKSSGFLVATPSGSHAWYSSMGGVPIDFAEKKIVYMTREPYCGKTITCNLKQGTCSLRQSIGVTYLLKFGGIVVVDSHECFPIKMNQTVHISASNKRLNWVTF